MNKKFALTPAALTLVALTAGCGGSTSKSSSPTATPLAISKTAPPSVVLTADGPGTKLTRDFTVGAGWNVAFDFGACAGKQAFGIQAFDTASSKGKNVADSQSNPSGIGIIRNQSAGRYDLSISGLCDWTVIVAKS